MKIFLLKYKWQPFSGFEDESYALVLANNVKEAVDVASKESKERLIIGTHNANDFRVVGELNKPTLLVWSSIMPYKFLVAWEEFGINGC